MVSVVSLYSGCGGMDSGFIQAGFKVDWAIDFDKAACDTYKYNLGECILHENIHDINFDSIPNMDVLITGPPCQGFSTAGKMSPNDERNILLEMLPQIVNLKKPKVLFIENVQGLTSFKGGSTLDQLVNGIENLGYTVEYDILNSSDFGIPQNRKRIIIFANRVGIDNFFTSFYEKYKLADKKNLFDAISDIEETGTLPNHNFSEKWPQYYNLIMLKIPEGGKLCNTRLGKNSIHTWNIPEVYGETTNREKEVLLGIAANRRLKKFRKKESWSDASPLSFSEIKMIMGGKLNKKEIEILLDKNHIVEKFEGLYDLKHTFNGKFRRLCYNKPSEAILTNFSSPRNYMHPKKHRPFTVRECARIQGFSDDFYFIGSLNSQYRMVGNAMPPKLSFLLAMNLKTYFNVITDCATLCEKI